MKKVLLIDNHDSFTWNLVQRLRECGAEVMVKKNDELSVSDADRIAPDAVVFSPGPGHCEIAEDVGVGPDIFKKFLGKIPQLGVCLGHQMIAQQFGATISKITPAHGEVEQIRVLEHSGLFQKMSDVLPGTRYHSQVVDRGTVPENFKVTAEAANGTVMAIEDRNQKIFGVQFHPESIGTPDGHQILKNFLSQ